MATSYPAIDAINQQWSDIKRRQRVAGGLVVAGLAAGSTWLISTTTWTWTSALQLGFFLLISLLGFLAVLDNNLFSTGRLLRSGLIPTPKPPLLVVLRDHDLAISRRGVSATIPLAEIRDAVFVFHDSMTQLRGLDDALIVHVGTQQLTVPESSSGFQELFRWIEQNRQLQRQGLE